MPFPTPHPGLVIHYAYLWHAEHLKGQEEGVKDRPCVIMLAAEVVDGETVVTVLPVTHTPPLDLSAAVEIPLATKQRLGLDSRALLGRLQRDQPVRMAWPRYPAHSRPSR